MARLALTAPQGNFDSKALSWGNKEFSPAPPPPLPSSERELCKVVLPGIKLPFQVRESNSLLPFITLWIRPTKKKNKDPAALTTKVIIHRFSITGHWQHFTTVFLCTSAFPSTDYKLLQGPGAIQLCAPFKSGLARGGGGRSITDKMLQSSKHTSNKGQLRASPNAPSYAANPPFFRSREALLESR